MDSICKSSTDNNFDEVSISTNTLKDIQNGIQIYSGVSARCDILKIRDPIKKTQSEWKGA